MELRVGVLSLEIPYTQECARHSNFTPECRHLCLKKLTEKAQFSI